jgi:hypothetical protein
MKFRFLFLCTFIACHSSSTISTKDSTQLTQDSDLKKSVQVIKPDSSLNSFRIQFPQNTSEVKFTGELDSPQQRNSYSFYAKKGDSLTAEILPDTTMANVRFNQIFMPGGTSDGPFGLTIHYALNETGNYKLIIAESLMAEPWTGKYAVHLKIK